jgi:hypothetical protein
MKYILPILAALSLCSCQTADQNAKLAAISNIALTYAEAKGAITPEDAALVREAGKVLLTPPVAEPIPEITVTSAK